LSRKIKVIDSWRVDQPPSVSSPSEHLEGACLHAEVPTQRHFTVKSFACLREAASAKAGHAGVAIPLEKTRLLPCLPAGRVLLAITIS